MRLAVRADQAGRPGLLGARRASAARRVGGGPRGHPVGGVEELGPAERIGLEGFDDLGEGPSAGRAVRAVGLGGEGHGDRDADHLPHAEPLFK